MLLRGRQGIGSLPVNVSIDAFYPDRRLRDIDNILKALLDALTRAGMWDHDSQVEALSIRKAGLGQHNPRLEILARLGPEAIRLADVEIARATGVGESAYRQSWAKVCDWLYSAIIDSRHAAAREIMRALKWQAA